VSEGHLQVCTAVPSEEAAGLLARRIVEARLAAAVQVVGPVRSTYWWRGAIRTSTEWLCLAKTGAGRFQELAALIAANHPYEVPEITATPITHGSAAYLRWIGEEAGVR
jgi:periplasmic divalent cation tolerance protein